MKKMILEGGIIIAATIREDGFQDFVEVKLKNNEKILITATAGGNLKIGKPNTYSSILK